MPPQCGSLPRVGAGRVRGNSGTMQLDGDSLDPLRQDETLALYRARRLDQPGTVLVLLPAVNPASPAARHRLTHEHALAPQLDAAWAAQPLAAIIHAGQPALILADAGGTPLAPATTGPLPLARFLPVAQAAALAIGAMHARGLIHKDIRPPHLLVGPESVESEGVGPGVQVRLTGFGIASQSSREQQPLAAPDTIAGTLAYMAPEQTGRMNRSVDTRADLYALGVTFYELLSGMRPFEATEPLEWVHCHVARPPPPLVPRVRGLPEPVEAIVMKLLAKPVEARYQTAAGLAADLGRCRAAFEAGAAMRPFPLGTEDIPDWLILPERLYGREAETRALATAFETMAATGQSRAVLVSGTSGTGKSMIANELRPAVMRDRGIMASGKAEQFHRETPYATLGAVLQNITERVLGTPPAERALWRQRLRAALGDTVAVLLPLAPALATLLGETASGPALSQQALEARLRYAIRSFIAVFVEGGYPFVLFIDDMQWLDAATFALLTSLFVDPPRALLLLGAYRSDALGDDHPLPGMIVAMRAAGFPLQEIRLEHLSFADLAGFVADALRTTPERATPLTRLVHAKTAGNPFFASQFLTALVDEGLVAFDHATRAWCWDLARIEAKGMTDNVGALVASRLVRLATPSRQLLVTLACLGSTAPVSRLALAHGVAPGAVHALAKPAVAAGLIAPASGVYGLVHDRVQEAVHALTAPDDRAALHLAIARRLRAGLSRSEQEEAVFELAEQYNRGIAGITDAKERREVAALNLRAGQRARDAAAFAAALGYFEHGWQLLGESGWADAGRLCFDLCHHIAECRFLTGEPEVAEVQLRALAARAPTRIDRAAVAALRITLYTALDRMDRAVETGLEFLTELGIHWDPHPQPEETWHEYRLLLAQLGDRPIGALQALPRLEDAEVRAVLDVLAAVLPPAFFTDENLVCLVLCRMAVCSLAHGNSGASPLGYAYLGMMLGPYFGDWRGGFEFGRLGQALVEEGGLTHYAARVQMCFAYHVAPWTRHIAFTLPRLRRAFEIAVQAGDLTYSGFSACTLVTSLIAAGTPLAEVESVAVEKLAFVRRARFGLIVDIITSQLCMVRGLRGYRPDGREAEGGPWDEAAFEARLQSEPSLAIAACWHWIRKLQAAVIRGAHAEALAAAARAEPLLWTSFGHLEMAEYHFHAGLAHAGCCGGAEDAPHRAAIARHREQLRLWAENCPENFAARAALLEGAVAAIEGRGFTALQHFEASIRSAAEHGLVQVEALAQEWAARFCRDHGFATAAGAHLRHARDCYLRWGATTKVQQLEQLDHGLADRPAAPGSNAEGGLGTIDLTSMIRTAQAVSGETGLTALIQTLMKIVLEHAGAERGLLLMPRADALRLEAEAVTGPGGITVRLPQRLVTETELPIGLVRHVLRVPETILIDDAARPGRFAEDGYLARSGSRSVLCIPLLRQLRLTGLLYLENSLAPYVFTPARVTVLQLLASQAAISLENATLEEKEALVREMHHRVKNNLQLVSSLLNLQAARVEDPAVAELFTDSRDRVRSMALVHENLYRAGDYARVPMRHHVETLCAQIERAYRGREGRILLDVSVEPIQLDLDRAISSGLIINELLSNAFKHAFPGDAAGRIALTLSQQAGSCVLEVRDDGIGMPAALAADLEASGSLGLQLVGDLVQQLHGSLALGPPPGAGFTVTFPLPEGTA